MKRVIAIALVFLFIVVHINRLKLYVALDAFFYLGFLILAVISIGQILASKNYNFTTADVILFLLLSAGIINDIFFEKNSYGSPQLYIILSAGLLYFFFSFLLQAQKISIKTIGRCVAAGVFIESLLAFAQIFGLISNANSLFVFGGSFGNPGALAAYLSVVSPFLLVALLHHKFLHLSENEYYVLLACFITAVFWIAFSNSRGAWLACAFGCSLVLNEKFNFLQKGRDKIQGRILKIFIAFTAFIILIAGGLGLYYYKKDSAFGRLLVWKIAVAQVSTKNILLGQGIGAFEANYGKWQAHYFATTPTNVQKKKVADYVTTAYNEYLELLINNGIIILLLLAIFIIMALKVKTENNFYVLAAKASVFSILIIALVSYPFSLLPVLLHLSLCLAIIFHFIQPAKINNQIKSVWVAALIYPLIAYALIYGSYFTIGFYHLKNGLQLVLNKKTEEAIKEYEKAYYPLQNNGLFLFYYGAAKAMKKKHTQSISLLEKAITKESDPNAYMLLGNEYKMVKQYANAETAYTTVTNMIPTKLYPKYLLAKLYITTNQTNKAIKQANEIITTNSKVHTTAADEIKNEMKEFLKDKQ